MKWEDSLASCFANQLKDVTKLTVKLMDHGPNLRPQCKQVTDGVFPWLLGALQFEGRSIEPSLINVDLWRQIVKSTWELEKSLFLIWGVHMLTMK